MKDILLVFIVLALLGTFHLLRRNYKAQMNKRVKDTADLEIRVDKLGKKYVSSDNNVGLVIGLVKGKWVHIQGYGRINKDKDEKPDGMSLFELASVGKLFTASALQIFADRQELSLDDSIEQYLQGKVKLPENAKDTTLRHLAAHTSGFPSIPENFMTKMTDQINPYKELKKEDMYEYLSSCEGKKKAGSYTYSNFGMGLLGHIFELKYNDTYENIIKKEICKKLGMDHTTITLEDEHIQLLAQGYNQSGQPNPVWEDNVLTGAGAFLSNALDMVKFIKANLKEDKSSISSSLVKTHINQFNGDTGLGWHYSGSGEKFLGLNNIIWHSGIAGGYSSYIAIDKENNSGVIVLSNTANDVRNLGMKIMVLASKLSFSPQVRGKK